MPSTSIRRGNRPGVVNQFDVQDYLQSVLTPDDDDGCGTANDSYNYSDHHSSRSAHSVWAEALAEAKEVEAGVVGDRLFRSGGSGRVDPKTRQLFVHE